MHGVAYLILSLKCQPTSELNFSIIIFVLGFVRECPLFFRKCTLKQLLVKGIMSPASSNESGKMHIYNKNIHRVIQQSWQNVNRW